MLSATEERDAALARVDAAAAQEWKRLANLAVHALAASAKPFTTDEVWELLAGYPDASTHEPRALGAVMAAHCRRGLIRKTGRQVPTKRAASHARPLSEWVGTGGMDW